jgi:hypothetical protein
MVPPVVAIYNLVTTSSEAARFSIKSIPAMFPKLEEKNAGSGVLGVEGTTSKGTKPKYC